MTRTISAPLSRRTLLAGLAAVCAGSALGCSSDRSGSPAAGGPSGAGWSFTDDTGATIERPDRPRRIVGLTDEIAALWNLGVVPVGSFGMVSARKDPQFAGKDLSGLTEVGTAYGEIDLEQLATLQPDLVVTHAYPDGAGGLEQLLYGFADQAQLDKVTAIAPVVAIAQRGRVDQVATRQSELAAALGAAPEVLTAAAADFRTAADELRAAARSGLSVLSIAAYETDGVYVMRAGDDPAFGYYVDELGLDYPTVAPDIFYWHHLSWEKIDTYRTDIVLASDRAMGPAALAEQPTFARLPAARAGQVYAKTFYPTDHVGQAVQLRDLTRTLTGARKVT